jgi:hypothetical protein
MITSKAKAIAAQRLDLIKRDLKPYGNGLENSHPKDLPRRVAARLHAAEQIERPSVGLDPGVASAAAGRLAGLEWRAVQAEVGWGRMRARRSYRMADVLARWIRRPWSVVSLVSGMRSALKARPLPELPAEPSADSYVEQLKPQVVAPEPARRPLPYPHVRVAHVGTPAMFAKVATHFDLETADLEKELATGFDMLLIEPGVDDRLEGYDETVQQLKQAGIRVLLLARTQTHLDHPLLLEVDLILTEDPDLAETATNKNLDVFHIQPSVDETIHNPIGWNQHPKHELMVIADHPDIGTELLTLAPLADQVSLYGPAIPGLEPNQHTPDRPIGKNQDQHAKNHRAVYATPQLAATPTSHIQQVLDLTAAGAIVITPPNPTLTELLDGHHLTATTSGELLAHLKTLQHPPTRERTSIPARRHVLTHHTRTHRFEQLLTHLDIPTNPTPRVSILLATKRPDHIEHALDNVTKQTWENKELILILHGDTNFDLPHIQTLTNQLPHPTTIVPCPDNMIFGDALNKGLDQATGHYISKMDDDDHYGPNHITDLITAHTYSNADITGKWGNIVYLAGSNLTTDYQTDREEQFGTHLPGATMILERVLLEQYRFERVKRRVDSSLWRRMRADGRSLYSTHRFNFIRVRHSDHTYMRGDEAFLATSTGDLRKGLDLDGSMI